MPENPFPPGEAGEQSMPAEVNLHHRLVQVMEALIGLTDGAAMGVLVHALVVIIAAHEDPTYRTVMMRTVLVNLANDFTRYTSKDRGIEPANMPVGGHD